MKSLVFVDKKIFVWFFPRVTSHKNRIQLSFDQNFPRNRFSFCLLREKSRLRPRHPPVPNPCLPPSPFWISSFFIERRRLHHLAFLSPRRSPSTTDRRSSYLHTRILFQFGSTLCASPCLHTALPILRTQHTFLIESVYFNPCFVSVKVGFSLFFSFASLLFLPCNHRPTEGDVNVIKWFSEWSILSCNGCVFAAQQFVSRAQNRRVHTKKWQIQTWPATTGTSLLP